MILTATNISFLGQKTKHFLPSLYVVFTLKFLSYLVLWFFIAVIDCWCQKIVQRDMKCKKIIRSKITQLVPSVCLCNRCFVVDFDHWITMVTLTIYVASHTRKLHRISVIPLLDGCKARKEDRSCMIKCSTCPTSIKCSEKKIIASVEIEIKETSSHVCIMKTFQRVNLTSFYTCILYILRGRWI